MSSPTSTSGVANGESNAESTIVNDGDKVVDIPKPSPVRRRRSYGRDSPEHSSRSGSKRCSVLRRSADSLNDHSQNQFTTDDGLKHRPAWDTPSGYYITKPKDEITPRYEVVRLLGEGTFGKVVECLDKTNETLVAVKIIRAIPKYRSAALVELDVLRTIRRHDPDGKRHCVRFLDNFEFRGHICMVFELLRSNIYEFLYQNHFYPFPLRQIQAFARQILDALSFMHELALTHTDIKPENILLVNEDYLEQPSRTTRSGRKRILVDADIRLIDFGSTVFETGHHTGIVSTRHYRAPEIVLELGWSMPCDLWSLGCMLLEFYNGVVVFASCDNLEHLALMERLLGKLPRRMTCNSRYFDRQTGLVLFPSHGSNPVGIATVDKMRRLEEFAYGRDNMTGAFFDLLRQLLEFDPLIRVSAKEALLHPFFKS